MTILIKRFGRISLSLSLLIWCLYLSYVLKILINNNLIFNGLQNIMMLLIAFISFRNIKHKNNYYFVQITTIIFLFYMIYNGIHNYIIFYLADISKYLLLFVLFHFNHKGDNEIRLFKIISTLVNTLYISVPLTIITAIIIGIQPGGYGERMVTSASEGFDSNPVVFISYAVFLAPYYKILNIKQKKLLIAALILEFFIGVFTATRGITILSILGLISIVYFNMKLKFAKILQLSLVFIVFAGLSSLIFNFSRIEGSAEYLIYRLTQSEDFSNGRDTEQLIYLASTTSKELLFGKGMGGANRTWIWADTPNGMSLLHKGYMYQILKGGFIWTGFYYLIFIFSLLNLLKFRKNYICKMAFISVSIILLSEVSHSIWVNPMVLIFQLYLLSYGLNINSNNLSKKDDLLNYNSYAQ